MHPDVVLNLLDAQRVVFSPQPTRAGLRSIAVSPGARVEVRVHRNVAAEHLFTSVAPFARFAGFEVAPHFTSYDDTLSFAGLEGGMPDLELIWIDIARLLDSDPDTLATHVAERLGALRTMSAAPFLVMNSGLTDARGAEFDARLVKEVSSLAGVEIADLTGVHRSMGQGFLSDRRTDLTAVPLSPAALVQTARELATRWLPALLRPTLKGIAVDLDNTLYSGVLGEDGAAGVVLGPEHRELQQMLHDLHKSGLFLAVVSRNEADDVAGLFASRDDFPLRPEDVDVWEVSWGSKSSAVTRAAAELRISADALLFLDDNPGEIMEVAGGSHCRTFVHAADPGAAILGLRFAPGMFRFRSGEADRLRVQDLRSERERQALQAAAADPTEYLRSLGVSLTFRVDQPSDLPRAAELSRKTNQFTTALARLDETQLAERMECGDARVVTVSLRDRLSDSGSIALIVGRLEGDTVLVEDVCMSCRAMGRGLESAIVLRAVDEITTSLGRHRVVFDVTDGPRNAPARSWLAGVTDDTARFDRRPPVDEDDPVNVEWVR